MAKITRFHQKLFGSTAASTEIGVFGSLAAGLPTTSTDPTTIQSLSNFLGGWLAAVVGGNSPAVEDMNALFFVAFRQLAYVMQTGVPEWNTSTVYYIGSICSVAGVCYVSLTDDNTGNAVTSTTNWAVFGGKSSVKTANYTALITDDVILCDASAGGFTVTLPTSASVKGKRFLIKKVASVAVRPNVEAS